VAAPHAEKAEARPVLMAAHGSASADACITGGDEAAPEFTPWEIRDEELTEAEDDVLADLPVPNSSGSGGGVLDGTERMKQDLSTKGIKVYLAPALGSPPFPLSRPALTSGSACRAPLRSLTLWHTLHPNQTLTPHPSPLTKGHS
jgi:hypothetical protein